jgi:hypothetical protein
MDFERKTITLNRASFQSKDWAHPTGKGRSGYPGSSETAPRNQPSHYRPWACLDFRFLFAYTF